MHTTGTDCRPLDDLLDGGLESDAITLVFGEGGSGKTNLALQCARVVAGQGRRVAYVDTEGVSQKRLAQVFDALPDDERAKAEERLLFYTPYTIAQQEKMVKATALLRDVGLIVVDSINMHYRLHIDEPGGEKEAARSLYQQLHHLTMHARQHDIPVLITGQVYGGEDATQPFARRVMEHLVKALVRFEKRPDGTRRATILKHRSIEEGRQARFRIGPNGLEGLDGATWASAASGVGAAADGPGPTGAGEAPAKARRHAQGPARPPPGSPADMDEASRSEARRDADAWGVDAGAQAAGDEPLGTGAGREAGAEVKGSEHPPRPVEDAAAPPGAEDPEAAPPDAAPPDADDPDAPATSLLTDEERREAEALPGFSPATELPPPERAEEGDEDR